MDGDVIVILIVLSAIGGFLSGLLGIGGGVIFVPILTFVFEKMGVSNIDFTSSVLANSFTIILFASAAATVKHILAKNIKLKYLLITGVSGVVTSLLVAYFVLNSDLYSKKFFLLLFFGILILVLIRLLFFKKAGNEKEIENIKGYKFLIVGAFTGIISGLTGVGGGVIMVPAFSSVLKVPLKIAIGLSTGAIFIFALTNFLQYGFMQPEQVLSKYQLGFIRFDIIIYPILAVLFFAPLGVFGAQKLKSKSLKWIFILLLVVIIIKTILTILKEFGIV